jgi:hypothetical protein
VFGVVREPAVRGPRKWSGQVANELGKISACDSYAQIELWSRGVMGLPKGGGTSWRYQISKKPERDVWMPDKIATELARASKMSESG